MKLGYPVLTRLSKCHKRNKQCLLKFYWACEYFLFDFIMLQTVLLKVKEMQAFKEKIWVI